MISAGSIFVWSDGLQPAHTCVVFAVGEPEFEVTIAVEDSLPNWVLQCRVENWVLQYRVGELGAAILGGKTWYCNTVWENWVLQYWVEKRGAAIQCGRTGC